MGPAEVACHVVFMVPFVAAVTVIFSLPAFYRSTALVLVERQQVPEKLRPRHGDERA